VPIVLKSGSLNLLEPSGPLQACNGIALPLFYMVWRFLFVGGGFLCVAVSMLNCRVCVPRFFKIMEEEMSLSQNFELVTYL